MGVGLGSAFPQGGDVLDSLALAVGHALVLIDTPDGPKRLRMVVGTHVGEREGRMVRHVEFERYAIILQAER